MIALKYRERVSRFCRKRLHTEYVGSATRDGGIVNELDALRARAATLAARINQLAGGSVTRRQAVAGSAVVAGGAVVAASAAMTRGDGLARGAVRQLRAGVQLGTTFVGNLAYPDPSGDVTGSTDAATISNLLSSGYDLILQQGTYYLNAPVVLPDQGYLAGTNPSWGIPTGNYGAGGLPLQGSIIQAGSGFAGSALISMGSAGTTQHGGQRLCGITLSGTGAPAGTHGILSTGYVAGVKMRDVVVWGMPGDGLHAVDDGTSGHQPDFWQVESSKFSHSGGWGVVLHGLADSWFTGCESTGNTSGGWSITGGADSRWIGCRADSNASGSGWNLTPTATPGYLEFTNCEANLNDTGWVFNGGAVSNYFLSNCIANNNTTAPVSYTAGAAVSTSGCNFSVWRKMTLKNGWANAAGNVTAQFQRRGNEVEIIGAISAAAATSTTFFTLPAVYAPASQQQIPAGATGGATAGHAPFVQCDTSGNLTLTQAAIGAADSYVFHGFISLDA